MKKLDAYRGRLLPAQVSEGINAANANARRLVEDATALLQEQRYPSAASLAILAIEEAGKVPILRGLSVARTEAEVRDHWKDYRSHTRKNVAWLLPQLAKAGAKKLEDLRPLFDEGSHHPHILDHLKQLGFYTDCLGRAHWSRPHEVVAEDLAESLVRTARLLARDEGCTVKEIELWVEHVGPVWKQDFDQMQQAVINWYRAMQEAGLKPAGENLMEHFVRTEIASDGPANDAGG